MGPLGGGSPMVDCEAECGIPACILGVWEGMNPKAESGRCVPALGAPPGAPLLDPACCWDDCPAARECSPAAASGAPAVCVALPPV